MESRRYYRTIVLSDIHLGTTHSKVEQAGDFLSTSDKAGKQEERKNSDKILTLKPTA